MTLYDKPVVALDVSGSSVKSALLSADRPLAGEIHIQPIDSHGNADRILGILASIIGLHLEQANDAQGVAFGFPGPFDYGVGVSLIKGVAKFETIYGVNVGEALKGLLGKPELQLRFRNDAEASIVGEAVYGAGRKHSRLLGITLGTGCGSAFIVDGRSVQESAGVPPNGWLYPMQFRNQLADDVFSTRGLLARLRQRGIVAEDVASAIQVAGSNEAAIIESFASFGADLGEFLQPFAASFRADAVLILGGIANTFDMFAGQISQHVSVPVLRGDLGERAALLGAAALFWDEAGIG